MTVKDLIKEKDYDHISFHLGDSLEDSIFFGVAKSENGELIPLDGDSYSENTEVIEHEEWNEPMFSIENGLTIVFNFKKGVSI